MLRSKLPESTKSSAVSSGRSGAARKGPAGRGELSAPPRGIKPRSGRLLREALGFLAGAEGGKDAEGKLKALFALYEEVDPYADYIRPGEREFFPAVRRERTIERFLEGFRYIYYILKRAEERLYLAGVFDNFWERSTAYLAKCGYSPGYISGICGKDSLFYRQSFSYWRREFRDSEEGLGVMYEYWKACFGIEGNDEYCAVDLGREVTYDWRRMKACREAVLEDLGTKTPEFKPPVYEEWSEKNVRLLKRVRDGMERRGREEEKTAMGADARLADIRRRNRERGIFQGA